MNSACHLWGFRPFRSDDQSRNSVVFGILALGERQRLRLFMRRDPFDRFVSCLVYVPRERMSTQLRNRIEARLGLRLSPTLIWQYPTIAALAEYLVEKQLLARVTSDTKSPTMAPPSAPTATAEEYEEGML